MKKDLLPAISLGTKLVNYVYCYFDQVGELEDFVGAHQLQTLRINGGTQISIVNHRGIQRVTEGDVIVKFGVDSFAIIPSQEFDEYLKDETETEEK